MSVALQRFLSEQALPLHAVIRTATTPTAVRSQTALDPPFEPLRRRPPPTLHPYSEQSGNSHVILSILGTGAALARRFSAGGYCSALLARPDDLAEPRNSYPLTFSANAELGGLHLVE